MKTSVRSSCERPSGRYRRAIHAFRGLTEKGQDRGGDVDQAGLASDLATPEAGMHEREERPRFARPQSAMMTAADLRPALAILDQPAGAGNAVAVGLVMTRRVDCRQ